MTIQLRGVITLSIAANLFAYQLTPVRTNRMTPCIYKKQNRADRAAY